MRFWDSSAIVPLLVKEANTDAVLSLKKSDAGRVVWWGTETECLSALARREREGRLDRDEVLAAEQLLQSVLMASYVVQPCGEVRIIARRLLLTHPLRAGDSLQLAASLYFAGSHAKGIPFVTLDKNLADCAGIEGFPVLPS